MVRHTGLAVLLIIGLAPGVRAQQPAPESRPASAETAVDVSRLPINLNRIHRELRQTTEIEERTGLNLHYVIDVYGAAPRINVLDPKRDNLVSGPVPYGVPTHQQMLEVMTPKEFRSPAMDFSALARWLSDKAKK